MQLLVKSKTEMVGHKAQTVSGFPVRLLICRLWDQSVLFLPYLKTFNPSLGIPGGCYKSGAIRLVSVFIGALKE